VLTRNDSYGPAGGRAKAGTAARTMKARSGKAIRFMGGCYHSLTRKCKPAARTALSARGPAGGSVQSPLVIYENHSRAFGHAFYAATCTCFGCAFGRFAGLDLR